METSSLAGLVVAISVATERIVEIIKGFFPFLNQQSTDAAIEGRRKAIIQLLAATSGVGTILLVAPMFPANNFTDNWLGKIALGLIASGGSGFWNSIQGYVAQAKEVKKAEVEEVKTRTTEQINYQRSRK